jgi:hypothetical protein
LLKRTINHNYLAENLNNAFSPDQGRCRQAEGEKGNPKIHKPKLTPIRNPDLLILSSSPEDRGRVRRRGRIIFGRVQKNVYF